MLFVIYQLLLTAIRLYNILIIIRCVLSFMPQSLYSPGGRFIATVTEPVLAPCRKLLSCFNIDLPIDLSPIIAFLFLSLLTRILSAFFSTAIR